MLVNKMSSLTSPLGHSSKYSENRSGNENRTNLANHSRTDLLCLRSKHIASYHSPAGPLQCTDTRISWVATFPVVVSFRRKLSENRKYVRRATYTCFHATQEPVTPISKTSYFFSFFHTYFQQNNGHCLTVFIYFQERFRLVVVVKYYADTLLLSPFSLLSFEL